MRETQRGVRGEADAPRPGLQLGDQIGSHSPVDLLASNGVETLAVQCKVGGYISLEEKTALIEWAAKLNARPCLARKNRSGRWTLLRVDEVNVLDLFEAAA
jgi:Holliday junction resolvase